MKPPSKVIPPHPPSTASLASVQSDAYNSVVLDRRGRQKAYGRRYVEAHRAEINAKAKADRAKRGDEINQRRRERSRERYANESPGARARRLEHQRQYRLATIEARRAYFREYYQTHKDNWGKNACPTCAGLKLTTAKQCKDCSLKRIREPRRVKLPPKAIPDCPYCLTEMRILEWHSTVFWRCPGCGLETTPAEVNRFHLEEAA
jgi:hypothetical protein